jgi:hypothetical protein
MIEAKTPQYTKDKRANSQRLSTPSCVCPSRALGAEPPASHLSTQLRAAALHTDRLLTASQSCTSHCQHGTTSQSNPCASHCEPRTARPRSALCTHHRLKQVEQPMCPHIHPRACASLIKQTDDQVFFSKCMSGLPLNDFGELLSYELHFSNSVQLR